MYLPTVERLFSDREDQKLISGLVQSLPDDPLIGATDAMLSIMRGQSASPPILPEGADDALFVRLLWDLPSVIAPTGTLRSQPRLPARRKADTSYDFIDRTCDWPWSIAKILNFVALGQIRPTRRAAVVATMRNDGLTALEFIAHYRALGFERIFIFSNDNADGTSELLSVLADQDIVTYIENPVSRDTSPQRKAFEYSIHFLVDLRDFEWVFFADSDEFLMPEQRFGFDIGAVLDAVDRAYPTDIPSAICYCWKWYGGHTFHREDGLQHEKFAYSRISGTVKSLARLRDIRSMRPLHYPICKRQSFFVNSALERVETALISRAAPNMTGGWVNHYWNKSFEEFALKRSRGEALDMDPAKNDFRRTDEQFFAWNVPATPEYYDPSPPDIVQAVRLEIARITALPGVQSAHRSILQGFNTFLRSAAAPAELRRRFDDLAPRFGHLKLRADPPFYASPVGEARGC